MQQKLNKFEKMSLMAKWLFGILVERNVVRMHFGSTTPKYKLDESEQLEGDISLNDCILDYGLVREDVLYFFEHWRTKYQLDGGRYNSVCVLL